VKNIARQALGMNPHQSWRRFHVAHHQGDRFFDGTIAIGT
jgi:hypothetical protein